MSLRRDSGKPLGGAQWEHGGTIHGPITEGQRNRDSSRVPMWKTRTQGFHTMAPGVDQFLEPKWLRKVLHITGCSISSGKSYLNRPFPPTQPKKGEVREG